MNMNNRTTQETDAMSGYISDWIEFAENLERKRNRWEETALLYCKNAEHHREMREKAERERDEARKERDILRKGSLNDPLLEITFREIARERDEARERERVAIASWDEERIRALREGERVIEAREQNAKLRDIAESAISAIPDSAECFGVNQKLRNNLRAELDQLKEGGK